MKEKNIFSLLKAKLERRKPLGFNTRFWSKFNSEFSEEKTPFLNWNLNKLVPTAALCLLVLLVALNYEKIVNYYRPPGENFYSASAILDNEEMIEDLDMFLTLEDMDLTEEEWEILLARLELRKRMLCLNDF